MSPEQGPRRHEPGARAGGRTWRPRESPDRPPAVPRTRDPGRSRQVGVCGRAARPGGGHAAGPAGCRRAWWAGWGAPSVVYGVVLVAAGAVVGVDVWRGDELGVSVGAYPCG